MLNNEINNFVGKKIKELRQEKELTQMELSKMIRVDESILAYYEEGLLELTVSKLHALAKNLDVSYSLFLPKKSA